MRKTIAYAAAATLALGAVTAPAEAAYLFSINQVGTNVVVTGGGSINLAALTRASQGPASEITGTILPNQAAVAFANGPFATYLGAQGASTFGSTNAFYTNLGSGPTIGVVGDYGGPSAIFYVPLDYVSGAEVGLTTFTFLNQSIASMGMTPGTYVWNWGTGADADRFTVQIGVTAVPEPATWAMMMLGFGAMGAMLRRRNTTARIRFA